MRLGELPENIIEKLDKKDPELLVQGCIVSPWTKKAKYQETVIALDFREVDTDGTLGLSIKLDKSINKFIPIVEMVSGCLIITLRKDK